MATNYSNGLGKEYKDPEERKRFLKDNADSVVNKTYMRQFTPEELQGFKEELAQNSIELNDLEQEKKAKMDEFKERMKPVQDRHSELIENIRKKAELVTGICYCIVVTEERMTYVYNEDGDCIEAHPCTADEMQKSIYEPLRKTGTDD